MTSVLDSRIVMLCMITCLASLVIVRGSALHEWTATDNSETNGARDASDASAARSDYLQRMLNEFRRQQPEVAVVSGDDGYDAFWNFLRTSIARPSPKRNLAWTSMGGPLPLRGRYSFTGSGRQTAGKQSKAMRYG